MKKIIIIFFLFVLPIEIIFSSEYPTKESEESDYPLIRIGVLAFRGKSEAMHRWTPTADYLSYS